MELAIFGITMNSYHHGQLSLFFDTKNLKKKKRRIDFDSQSNFQAAIIEFDKTKFEVQESDKLVSLPILRTGDLSVDVQIECYTQDVTASANADYVPRYLNSFSVVKIPAGEIYGFCDIELIDDDVHESDSEVFKVLLANPTQGVEIGRKNEAAITIIGPNDGIPNVSAICLLV
jgi:hypothetical protein